MPSIAQELADLPRRLHERAARNVRDATLALAAEVQEVLSVQGSPSNRSRPGEAPRRQTGRLQGSVTTEIDEARATGRVIIEAPYASYLISMNRPIFELAIRRARSRIDAIMARP